MLQHGKHPGAILFKWTSIVMAKEQTPYVQHS